MCYLSIPNFFMPMLMTRDNSLQLFLRWEGVGLASYLLIKITLIWKYDFELFDKTDD